jgi:hypothetical protein
MSRDIEKPAATSEPTTTSGREVLKVEIKVRELESTESDAVQSEAGVSSTSHDQVLRWVVLAAVLLIAGTYVGLRIGNGWVPADDGTLAQSALRVLQGQLPHRDYAEIYTGGLSMIHALAFRTLGVNLMSLRICVFLFFLAWIPAVYYIALRFTSALGAGLVTLLAVSWSFPNYPAAMPSWYNLFFATFGAAALLRYLEVRTRKWLLVAGLCGGLSLAIKVIGAYFIAGALLFLAFLEQSDHASSEPAKTSWGYRAFSLGALSAFLGTLLYVLHARLTMAEFYHFVLPSTAMVSLILFGDHKVSAPTTQRFAALLRFVTPFGLGVLTPLAMLLAPYALSGSLRSFASGMASSVAGHVADLAVIRPAPLQYVAFVLPLLAILAAAMYWDKFQGKAVGAAFGVGAIVIAVRATQSMRILSGVWFSAVMLTPVVVCLGVVVVAVAARSGDRSPLQRQQVMLLTSLAATCTLVQYPFAAPVYLCYALPLTLLALVSIVSTSKKQPGTYVLVSVAVLYTAFGVVSLIPMQVAELTHEVGHMDKLRLPRGGVRIENARVFEELSRFLQQHSPNGLLYAGNDCPEVYFLSGLKNITRDDAGAKPDEVLRALQSTDVKVVVINEAPFFPVGRMNSEVRAEVEKKFPNHGQAGIFQVFWRE